MQNIRYPKIFIRSKTELERHISHKGFPRGVALSLINDTITHFNEYWKDNKKYSNPAKGKYVRNAKGTPLGLLLKKINERILKPYDKILPNFIFGGISGLDHVKAATHLLGKKRRRTLLKTDIKCFFEQINAGRVRDFFVKKCQCTPK